MAVGAIVKTCVVKRYDGPILDDMAIGALALVMELGRGRRVAGGAIVEPVMDEGDLRPVGQRMARRTLARVMLRRGVF